MTNTNFPELPQAIGVLAGRRLDPPGTTEFFGYFNAGFGSEYKEPIYTADQMRAYALATLAQSGQGEAVYQYQKADGSWIDQDKSSYDYNVRHGAATVRVVYTRPQPAQPLIARNLGEWHEDDGPVMWWAWNGRDWAGEPAWIGTPNDSDWPGYHTHWTGHPEQPIQDKRVEHSGSEPWYGHRFCEVRKGLWRCGCGKTLEAQPSEAQPARVVDRRYLVRARWPDGIETYLTVAGFTDLGQGVVGIDVEAPEGHPLTDTKYAAAPAPSQAAPCKGMNCGRTDGVNHSLECQAEHAAAITGGTFVKQQAAVTELVERLTQELGWHSVQCIKTGDPTLSTSLVATIEAIAAYAKKAGQS
jgi:hypothetical protein